MTRHLSALFTKSAVCAALTLALLLALTGCGGGGTKQVGQSGAGVSPAGQEQASGQTYTVTGLARLGSGSDHSGIVVSLDPVTSGVTRPARAALVLSRRDASSRQAVARAASAAPAFSAVTDASGRYTIAGVPGGEYVALAQKDHARKAIHLGYRVGTATTTLDFVLTPTGDITGVVKDATGAGVENAIVAIPGTSFLALTNTSGEYTLSDVPVATYSLVAIKGSATASVTGVSVTAAQQVAAGLLTLAANPTGGADNSPPVFITSPPTGHPVGVSFTYTATALDPEGQSLTYTLKGNVAPGLSLTGNVLSGVPVTNGTYDFFVVADDGNGGKATHGIRLTISNQLPVFTNTFPSSASKGNAFAFTPAATDNDTHTVAISVQGTLPPGIDFAGGAFSGTPTAVGTYTFTLVADDGHNGTTQQPVTFAVTNANPVFTSTPPTSTTIGNAMTAYTATATDADGHALSFSTTGTLPPGVTFNVSTRVLSGTPTATGAYAFAIVADDGQGGSGTQNISLNVTNNNPAFGVGDETWMLNINSPVSDATGSRFTINSTATDADGHGLTYSAIAGGLGPGLAWNGSHFTGVPTTLGNSTFTWQAADGFGGQGSKTITFQVVGFQKIAAGGAHTCGLKTDGTVACWGSGYGNSSVAVNGLSGVSNLAASDGDTCGLKTDSTVVCWAASVTSTPVAVSGLSGVSDIAAGGGHKCAVKTDGTVACWGRNWSGQLGDGTQYPHDLANPVQVVGLSGVSGMAAGFNHTCALKTDGTVACWGGNGWGELGNGTTDGMGHWTAGAVTGLTGVSQLAAGDYHTCALKTDGTVACWGYNFYGQLGNGTTAQSSTPVAVSGLSGVSAVSAGYYHTCALKTDGSAVCWGTSGGGQGGNGTNSNSHGPTAVSGLAGISELAAGSNHTCAVMSSGAVACWGYNHSGQLGIGSTGSVNAPVYLAPGRISP